MSDFLDFSRPRPVRIQSLWLPGLMEEVKASWETDPRNEGLQLQVEGPPGIWIQGDQICVHQVFTNLLSNARKALEGVRQPAIHIRFPKVGKALEVEVEDNGCGMTPEQLHTVFLPFSSSFREGTGLGMSLVFQFVQRMGWDIRIVSQAGMRDHRAPDPAPGDGTTGTGTGALKGLGMPCRPDWKLAHCSYFRTIAGIPSAYQDPP